jgi:chromosome segregation ATPase
LPTARSEEGRSGVRADTALARMLAITGVDLMDGLDHYRGAQQEAGKVRERIAATEAELVQLRARYDGYDSSPYNQQRKKLLAQLAEDERARAIRSEEKVPSEAKLDNFAHAHPQYARYLEDGGKDRLLLEEKRARLNALQGELETALGVVSYYDKVCRANDAVIGFARAEMGLTR